MWTAQWPAVGSSDWLGWPNKAGGIRFGPKASGLWRVCLLPLFSRIVIRIKEGHSRRASKSHLDNNLRIFRPRIMRVPSRKHEHTPRRQLRPFTLIKALSKRIPVIPAYHRNQFRVRLPMRTALYVRRDLLPVK